MTSDELILLNFSEAKKIIKIPLNMATPCASKKREEEMLQISPISTF